MFVPNLIEIISIFEIDTTTFVILSSLLIFILQLLLCLKAKKLLIKLLPPISLAVLAIAFFISIIFCDGWNAIGCLFIAIFAVGLLFICAIAWGIWAIIRKIKKHTTN